ncbi:MAG: TonB-dependent receptor [Burkholderiales bacterium]|nr:TonB-dependent receptor [Burkholderiales bacterium]MDE2566096.1 TonB-dependent receptor [Burkholderiales bacterium]
MKTNAIASAIALLGLAGPALAQGSPAEQRVEVTGSSIKQIDAEGALPVQVITRKELDRQGITTAEQLILQLNVNGNGVDNLASNSDVAAGSSRGNNGLSAANLRMQGANATLVLLNGRRVAIAGLSGGVVDLQQIPFEAIERVEVLKDGASSLYGSDAIGGVINFITRKDYRGLQVTGLADLTQHAGGNIAKASFTAGKGNLDSDHYNVLVTAAYTENQALRGDQRNFVNTFQPNRGLSPDTRGDPYATLFAISSVYGVLSRDNLNGSGRGTGPTLPGGTQTYNGINTLNLPGQPGCNSIAGMGPYAYDLWSSPGARYGCAWDTGRAAALQQPVKNANVLARGTLRLGEHELFIEATAAQVKTQKSFSPNQITSSNFSGSPFYKLGYPSTGAAYAGVFNALVGTFPQLAANNGLPMPLRWRCMPCGNRQIGTTSDTGRVVVGANGPLGLGDWDYRAGLSSAYSDSKSKLAGGYFYGVPFAALINTGVLNPFPADGISQTPAALSALAATSANGVTLYGGKYTSTEADATFSGTVASLPAGPLMAAVGVDLRSEKYQFNGNATDLATQSQIFNAPFDSINTLAPVKRNISAAFTEWQIPVTKALQLTLSARIDKYTGFGSTTNPKVAARYAPLQQLMFRGSYSTGFRVPTFAQEFFGVTQSQYTGANLVDPQSCPSLVVSSAPGCASITPQILTGGKPELGPEKAKMANLGFVWQPTPHLSGSLDWWSIERTGTIQSLDLTTLLANYASFQGAFIRDASGNLVTIDDRWINAGGTRTRGLELTAKADGAAFGGRWGANFDLSYLLDKRSRVVPGAPWGPSEVAVATRTGDLGIRWKHTLELTYARGVWSSSLSQVWRSGYQDFVLPGVANGSVSPPDWNPRVKAYVLYNASVTYTGIKNLTLLAGVKNLFDTKPPFSATYDTDTGAGSSWEPRVADPRLRSFLLQAGYKFF